MMLKTIRETAITPRGFGSEKALVEGIARSCAGRKTAMITGNYTVMGSPETPEGDPRLLGRGMLLTIELAGRAYGKCVEMGIEPPTVVLLPNDIAPGLFESNREGREFKASYAVPEEITGLLSAHGLVHEPIYFFRRDFDVGQKQATGMLRLIRERLRGDGGNLVVIFESFAQNLASKALKRGRIIHGDEIIAGGGSGKAVLAPATARDSFSGQRMLASTLVQITRPNGAPFCSFLAATLFREFEMLGFQQMVNTFVMEEYPCVDKAAAAYKYLYGGRMAIRNIYMNGTTVEVDSTIE
jgi:hypothetical protein